jgi:ATP-dependent helicase/nuclease subunit B
VVIVGAADGLLPSVRNANPLINDATRKTLRVNPADSPTVVELEERNRRDLLAALTGSRILAVTFPRGAIPDSGVSKVSRYFTSDQSNDRTSYKSFQHALDNGPNPITDIDMAIVLCSGTDYVAQELEHIVQSFQSWARPEFTENFGNFGEGEVTWDLGGVPLSASAIESYLHCPYGFFVNRVLGFSTDTFDDEVEEISSKDLGLLLHEALEDLVTAARDNEWLPAPGEPWSATAPHQAIEIFLAKAADAELKGLTGWKPAWESVRQEIVEAIPQFLEVDSAMRSEPPMSPGQAELGFGFDGAPFAEIETSRNTTVQLRGAIDRLDLSPDGTSARVVDYKSGKAINFSKALRNREKIQDLVYSAAVRALLPEVRYALVTFLFVPNQGDVVTIDAAFERDPFEELVEILDRLEISAITGSFPPKYSGSRDYCPVCSILGRRANRIDNHSKEIAEKDSPLLMTSTDGAPNDK